jgi:uncharacterized membrane protein YeiH
MMYYLDLLGTIIFAVTGSLAAGRKHLDIFGVVVLSLATALGGGTIRDVTLGALPVFWVKDPLYVIVTVLAALATFVVARFWRLPAGLLQVADAFGLAVFTILGAERALAADVSPLVAVIMGMMTGVAGGMIRDVLSGEAPLILRREIYATASLCGAAVFVGLTMVCPGGCAQALAGAAVTLGLRLAAIKWDLSLPQFFPKGTSDADR